MQRCNLNRTTDGFHHTFFIIMAVNLCYCHFFYPYVNGKKPESPIQKTTKMDAINLNKIRKKRLRSISREINVLLSDAELIKMTYNSLPAKLIAFADELRLIKF